MVAQLRRLRTFAPRRHFAATYERIEGKETLLAVRERENSLSACAAWRNVEYRIYRVRATTEAENKDDEEVEEGRALPPPRTKS